MGITEEETSMSDKNKKKAGLPDIKVIGLFLFLGGGTKHRGCFILININIVRCKKEINTWLFQIIRA